MGDMIVGFLIGALVIIALATSPSTVCRNAAGAPDDKTIVYQDKHCVRLTSQPLEIKP